MTPSRRTVAPAGGPQQAVALGQIVPETLYFNASVITMDPAHPTAQAFAIAGDRFVMVGGNDAVPADRRAEHPQVRSRREMRDSGHH